MAKEGQFKSAVYGDLAVGQMFHWGSLYWTKQENDRCRSGKQGNGTKVRKFNASEIVMIETGGK